MSEKIETMAEGRYLRLVKEGRWEFVERCTVGGAVVIVPLTDSGKVIFVEQHRIPTKASVIEFPAGLVGDNQSFEGESMEVAAERELLEETGYAAEQMEYLTHGPPSPGLSSETVTFFRASGLRRVGEGGGDESEDITIHKVPLDEVSAFLAREEKVGKVIDPKIFIGLYFLGARSTPPAHEISIDLPQPEVPKRLDSPIGFSLADRELADLDEVIPHLPESRRVGILGGSFNPPHVGHALLAHALLSTEAIDELWVIPVAKHPFGKGSVSFEHRMEMCRLAFGRLGKAVRVLDIERHLPTPSFTVQTLSALHAVRPGIKPTLIIGSDIVPELPMWREPQSLPVLSRIVVVPRQGAPEIEPPEDLGIKIYQGFRLPKVSSTAIKEALLNGERVDGLLDLNVLDYIRKHKLYTA